MLLTMDLEQFWKLIDRARADVDDAMDNAAVAARATDLLAGRRSDEIVTAQQILWDLMAESYRAPLWAAAYLINGGCSDDGFDYFRGWLIVQGRETFERVVANPDVLADLSAVRAAAADQTGIDGEETLSIAWDAHIKATGEQLPADAFTIRFPVLDEDWDFDFDDDAEMARRLPRIAGLYLT
jgi:hypothetical protein